MTLVQIPTSTEGVSTDAVGVQIFNSKGEPIDSFGGGKGSTIDLTEVGRFIGEQVRVANGALVPDTLVAATGRIVSNDEISPELKAALLRANPPAANFVQRKPAIIPGSDIVYNVGYIDGKWVVVSRWFSSSSFNSYYIYTSPDGINWTAQRSVYAENTSYASQLVDFVIVNGLLWGFAQSGARATIFSSPDGVNWTLTNTNSAGPIQPAGVLFYPARTKVLNGKIVNVGSISTSPPTDDYISFSADNGATWQGGRMAINGARMYAVAYANINGTDVYVSGGYNGKMQTSSDLVAWTERNTGITETIYAIEYFAGKFVAFCSSGRVISSVDGVNWAKEASINGITTPVKAVVIDGGETIILVAYASALDTNRRVVVSSDLVNWRNERIGNAPDGEGGSTGNPTTIWEQNGQIAIGTSLGIGITNGAVDLDPLTETWIPHIKADEYTSVYFVDRALDEPAA